MLQFIIIVISVLIKGSGSARILAVMPSAFRSHQIVYRPLLHELVKRGHQLVLITADPAFPKGKAPANLTEIDVRDISYDLMKNFVSTLRGNDDYLYSQMDCLLNKSFKLLSKITALTEVQDIINQKNNFDLIFTETCLRSMLIYGHFIKAPVIQISSMGGHYGTFESMGATTNPLLYPTTLNQNFVNLTIWDKITELYNLFTIKNLHADYEKKHHKTILKKEFGPDVPTFDELNDNIHITFLNIHPLWDSNRPVPPSVIYLGGMHENPAEELPKKLKRYLDSSTNGVIYMSLGTNVQPSLLSLEKIQMFLKVFSTLPHNVMWKWDKEELEGRPSNVQISKWFPQSDVLRHPNVKLFITQGGMQSTDEALSAGVPLVGIPMLGDQWYNTELYVHHKIGVKLNLVTLTEEDLKNAIDTVLNDESYRFNVIRLRALMRDQPQTALERAVWWTEHVLRHRGAKHLRTPAVNKHWTEYYELELALGVLTVLVISLVIIVFMVKFLKSKLFK